jgi:hypothetical protein
LAATVGDGSADRGRGEAHRMPATQAVRLVRATGYRRCPTRAGHRQALRPHQHRRPSNAAAARLPWQTESRSGPVPMVRRGGVSVKEGGIGRAAGRSTEVDLGHRQPVRRMR